MVTQKKGGLLPSRALRNIPISSKVPGIIKSLPTLINSTGEDEPSLVVSQWVTTKPLNSHSSLATESKHLKVNNPHL